MSIVLTATIRIGGAPVGPAAGTLTLSQDLESDLVHRGLAKYVRDDTGLPYPTDWMVPIEKFGARPENTARENTRAFLRALDVGGMTTLMRPGPYLVADRCVLQPNAGLHIGHGVTWRQAPGTSKSMLVNAAYLDAPINVTLSWTSGITMNVQFPAGQRPDLGDHVSVFGVTPAPFVGVFPVLSVVDATTVTVRLWRVPTVGPTAVGASVQAKLANAGQTVILDGMLDYARSDSNNSALSANDRHAVILGHACGLSSRVRGINAQKYVVCVGAVVDAEVRVYAPETNSDILKVYGPVRHGTFASAGRAGDDAISLQCKEPTAFADYRWTEGDVLDVRVTDINARCEAATSLCVLYPNGSYLMDDIVVDGVHGFSSGNAVRIQGDIDAADATGGQIGKATFYNIDARANYAVKSDGKYTADEIVFVDTHGNQALTTAPPLLFLHPAIIEKLTVVRPYTNDSVWPSAGAAFLEVQCTARTISVEDPHWRGSGGNLSGVQLATANCVVDTLTITRPRQRNGSNLVRMLNSVTSNPTINVSHGDLDVLSVCNLSNNATVVLNGNRIDGVTNGVLRCDNTAAITLRTDGSNDVRSGSWVVSPTGTPTVTLDAPECVTDPLATFVATTAGQRCRSNRAGANGGNAVRTSVGWIALGTAAAGANTVIA